MPCSAGGPPRVLRQAFLADSGIVWTSRRFQDAPRPGPLRAWRDPKSRSQGRQYANPLQPELDLDSHPDTPALPSPATPTTLLPASALPSRGARQQREAEEGTANGSKGTLLGCGYSSCSSSFASLSSSSSSSYSVATVRSHFGSSNTSVKAAGRTAWFRLQGQPQTRPSAKPCLTSWLRPRNLLSFART